MEPSQVPVQCVRACLGSLTPRDSGPRARLRPLRPAREARRWQWPLPLRSAQRNPQTGSSASSSAGAAANSDSAPHVSSRLPRPARKALANRKLAREGGDPWPRSTAWRACRPSPRPPWRSSSRSGPAGAVPGRPTSGCGVLNGTSSRASASGRWPRSPAPTCSRSLPHLAHQDADRPDRAPSHQRRAGVGRGHEPEERQPRRPGAAGARPAERGRRAPAGVAAPGGSRRRSGPCERRSGPVSASWRSSS